MRQIILAKSLVVNTEGKVLVLRRASDDTDHPGRVDFPGGGMDEGESYTQTAIREAYEEAGLRVREQDLTLAYTYTRYEKDKDTIVTRLLYIARDYSGNVKLSNEHDAYWWVAPTELKERFKDTSWEEAVGFVLAYTLLDM